MMIYYIKDGNGHLYCTRQRLYLFWIYAPFVLILIKSNSRKLLSPLCASNSLTGYEPLICPYTG